MQNRAHYSRVWRTNTATPETVLEDRVVCAVCFWPANDIEEEPAARLGAKPTRTTGSTYVWARPDEPVSTLDKEVVAIRQYGECDFCGAELFLDGRRGSALRIP